MIRNILDRTDTSARTNRPTARNASDNPTLSAATAICSSRYTRLTSVIHRISRIVATAAIIVHPMTLTTPSAARYP